MKKLAVVVAAVLTFSLGMNAQDGKTGEHKKEGKMEMKKDHVMMKDGKMMTMMGGKMAAMDKDMTMSDGTMVMMDGTVKTKDGKTTMLKNGEGVDMDGKMMMHHGHGDHENKTAK